MNEKILRYLAEKSGISVWIADRDGEIIFSSVDDRYIKRDEASGDFFRWIFQSAEQKPWARRIDDNDLTASFAARSERGDVAVFVGPAYEVHPFESAAKRAPIIDVLIKPEYVKMALLGITPVSVGEFCRFAAVVAQIVTGEICDEKLLQGEIKEYALADIMNTDLAEAIFDLREEEQTSVYSPAIEKKVLECIKNGDAEALGKFKMPSVKSPSTQNTRHQNVFEAVALVTLATRAAIDGGVDYVKAFSLSDLYFKRLSDSMTDRQVTEIMRQALYRFARIVADSKHGYDKEYSPYIRRAEEYVRANLHYDVSLDGAAQALGISPKYLSRIFVTCTGEKFSTFVQKERIREACNLLENTDRSIVDIGYSLGFSSQSYFIKVFKEHAGMTPNRFIMERGRVKHKSDRVEILPPRKKN